MALKGFRNIGPAADDISFFMNQTAERGIAVVLSTAGSGAAMDDGSAIVTKPTASFGSGEYPLGILLNDVVSGDLTKTHLNQYKFEVQVGGKVEVLRRGTILTNMIEGTPAGGQAAFISSVGTDGKISGVALGATSPLAIVGAASGQPFSVPYCKPVGTFLSSKDSDGYAKVDVNLI
jgi:hypothetical protein